MARPRKKVEEGAPQEQPVHDPEAERAELTSEAQESAPESEQSEPSSEGSGDSEAQEAMVAVMANPALRAARVRVRDASGKEHVVEAGKVIHVPSSAYDRNPTYLNKV
jgi:hypothetical protein